MSVPSRRLLLASLLSAAASGVSAGPIIDAIRERREQRRAAEGDDDTEGALSGRSMGRLKGEVKLPEGARLQKDLAFGSDPQQKLDVYLPKGATHAPILFMVHGGAWMLGDKAYLPVVANKVSRWLPKGYALVSTNYRMARRQPDVLAQLDDVAQALAFVQKQAASWGCDPARVLVMGHSAGAHLVSLLAASPTAAAKAGVRPWLGTVSLDSAALNVPEIMGTKHYRFYDTVFGKDQALWTAASPYHQLAKAPPPMLLVCATGRPDSCPQAEAFAAKVKSLGGQASVMPVQMKHGDTNTQLGAESGYTSDVERFMRSLGLP